MQRRERAREGAYLILGTSSCLSLPFPSFCPILESRVVVDGLKKNVKRGREEAAASNRRHFSCVFC